MLLTGILMLAVAAAPPAADESLPPVVPEARKDALARFGAGLWQERRQRLLSAIQSLELAARQDPDATAALKELIAVYSQIGREPDAIRTARFLLEKDPRDVDTAHALSRLLFDSGELGDAISFAKVAADNIDASARPEKALAIYRDLATLLDRHGEFTAAAKAWQRAADLLTIRRKAILALHAFTPQELDTETADVFERLGKALVKDGRSSAAADAFLVAYKLYADPLRVNDRNGAARLDWNLSSAFAEKKPAEALAHLEAFLKLRPQAVEPYERLVVLMHRAGRGEDAAAELRKYVSKDPENLPLRAELAAELSRGPESRPAGDGLFAKLLAETHDSKIVRVAMQSFLETTRPGKIIAELDQTYKVLGDVAAKAGERAFATEKARSILDILRTEPEWTAAIFRTAADELRSGVSLHYQTRYALGLLAVRHRKLDFAIVQLREAARMAPPTTQGEVYVQIVNLLSQSHNPAALEKFCSEMLQRNDLIQNPQFSAYFQRHLAIALARLGEDKLALLTIDKAIAQSGDHDRLGYRLVKADILGMAGQSDTAIALCKKLLEEFTGPADRIRIRYILSSIYWGAKKRAEAETELRAILDADSDHAGACNNLGFFLSEQGRNLDEAERLIRRAIAVDRTDRRRSGEAELESAAYLDSLAWVLFRKEKLAEARSLLEKAAALPDGASDGTVLDHLGDVRYRLGEKEKARAAWEEAERLLSVDSRGKRDSRLDEVKRKLKRLP